MASSNSGPWAVGAAALSYGFRHKLPHTKLRKNSHVSHLQRVLPVATTQIGRGLSSSYRQPDTGAFLALKAKHELLLATTLLFQAFVRQLKAAVHLLGEQQKRLRQAAECSAAALTNSLPGSWSPGQRREGLFRFGGSAKDLVRKGKKLESELDVRAAAKCFEEAIQQRPKDPEFWSLLSKATSDMTYLDEIQGIHREKLTDDDKRAFNKKAMEHAKKAVDMDPKAFLPHIAACISMGRLALFADNKSKCQLAKEARAHAVRALELGPDSDLTHHLMGRWHYEMAQLNMVVRTLIRVAFGTNLPTGTIQDALVCYQHAAKLNPASTAHHVEIGRCLSKMGRRSEAIQVLQIFNCILDGMQHASTLDYSDINTYLERLEGEKILKGLDGGWMPRWPLGKRSQVSSPQQPAAVPT